MTRSRETPAAVQSADLGQRIRLIRGHRVLLDSDLAALYGVPTFRFNEAVRRNAARFPPDFAFRLTAAEHDSLRSQIAILKAGRRQHQKYLRPVSPLTFDRVESAQDLRRERDYTSRLFRGSRAELGKVSIHHDP